MRAGHAGRLGAYTEALTYPGYMGVAFCSGPRSGHRVAPFGAIDGRLSTNPLSFAVPTTGAPLVADFSTSTVPEGVVRRLRTIGQTTPAGALQDAEGHPSDDPHVLYETPPGTILPLGGPLFGHKGYALALLVEALTTVLCGEDMTDAARFGNNVTIIAIAAGDKQATSASILTEYLRSARPADADKPVLVPGDPEREALTRAQHVLVEPEVWDQLLQLGERLGVEPPERPSDD
jgi:LDH2 family malate/lactate/ureidoglycolate dehydrogenase